MFKNEILTVVSLIFKGCEKNLLHSTRLHSFDPFTTVCNTFYTWTTISKILHKCVLIQIFLYTVYLTFMTKLLLALLAIKTEEHVWQPSNTQGYMYSAANFCFDKGLFMIWNRNTLTYKSLEYLIWKIWLIPVLRQKPKAMAWLLMCYVDSKYPYFISYTGVC